MEASYVRLGYIDEKATIFVLRVAFAFLAAASLFALAATLVYIKAANNVATYVAALSAIMTEPGGIVVHNLHAGSRALNQEVSEAACAYARAFGDAQCCQLATLDSKPWAGNAILGATRTASVAQGSRFFAQAALAEAATAARKRWGVGFDLATRCALDQVGAGEDGRASSRAADNNSHKPASCAAVRKTVRSSTKRASTRRRGAGVSDLFRPDSLGGQSTEGTKW